MKLFSRITVLVMISFLCFSLTAQESKEKSQLPFISHWTAQVNGGLTEYFGDLNKDDFFNRSLKAGFGGALGYQFTPVLGVRGQFLTGKLYSELESKDIKLSTDLWDLGLHLTLNVNELFSDYNPERFFNFYLFSGAGLTSFKSKTNSLSTGLLVSESSSRQNELFVPMGAGIALNISKKLSLNMEYGDHLTFKDGTLDLYPSSKARDWYSYAAVGVGLKFGGPRDTDKDGVIDKKDQCPDRSGKVELNGCPDTDNDGIADDQDECKTVAGKAEFKGCPDTDGDGIPDKDDLCPSAAGSREMKGCPDKDHDGIADKDDKCPDVSGKKELNGCPDRDGDNIADNVDKCPDMPGTAAMEGCPDKDGDGIADNLDKCPEVPGSRANNGCPDVEKALISEIVYFNSDEDIVLAEYNQLLYKVIELLKDNPGARIAVDGHTDSRESLDYNMKLSERRADRVIQFIRQKGIDSGRIVKSFYGETRPVADNETEDGRKLNRRVEIRSVK